VPTRANYLDADIHAVTKSWASPPRRGKRDHGRI
jgi:hypothetical protein